MTNMTTDASEWDERIQLEPRQLTVTDSEAIIEAMAEAMAFAVIANPGESPISLMARAAYEASPIERYRTALEEIATPDLWIMGDLDAIQSLAERALREETTP